ncbi:MAG: hypothetical protein JRJ12_10440 [Deltaproteobacteria bacterium]|nr:hypothetical protein [Deltaproteobacteria bacterium]MBW2070701.1 hypothetical protein [Deltaproteobacteria bacterium]
MRICKGYGRKVCWLAVLLLLAVVMAGCAGVEPYQSRNHREEGPEKGLFTGSQGEFVILRKAGEAKKSSEDKKSPNEPETSEQQVTDSNQSGKVAEPSGDTL